MKAKLLVGLMSVFVIGALLSACSEESMDSMSNKGSAALSKVMNPEDETIVITCLDCGFNGIDPDPNELPANWRHQFNFILSTSHYQRSAPVEGLTLVCSSNPSQIKGTGFHVDPPIDMAIAPPFYSHTLTIIPENPDIHYTFSWSITDNISQINSNENILEFETTTFTESISPIYAFPKITVQISDGENTATYKVYLSLFSGSHSSL